MRKAGARKRIAASRTADEFRASGNSVDADKFDALANLALQRQMTAESTAKGQEPGLAAQNEIVDKLKGGLDQMKGKLYELTAKRKRTGGPLPDGRRPGGPRRVRKKLDTIQYGQS